MFKRLLASFALAASCSLHAQTFFVNSSGDENDPMDGLLTLREAIAFSNGLEGHDTIELQAGIEITTSIGYVITDDVSIIGDEAAPATLLSQADLLFDLVGNSINVDMSNLTWTGSGNSFSQGATYGIRACGNVSLMNFSANMFYRLFDFCPSVAVLNVSQSILVDNLNLFSTNLSDGSTAEILLEKSYIENSSIWAQALNANLDVEIRESLYIFEEAYCRIGGSASMLIRDSSLLLSESGPMLRADYDSKNSLYYFPTLEIEQSTLAGHQSGSPLIMTTGADVSISHSTLADNNSNKSHLLWFRAHTPYGTDLSHGRVEIDHTVVDRFISGAAPINLDRLDLTASHSFIPFIERQHGTESVTLDSHTSVYQGAPAYLGEITFGMAQLPYYLPQSGSPVIDAGDPEAVAGEGGIPAHEQRQSERVLGGRIDIGSTEYNNEPLIDLEALRIAYQEQVAALADPDDDIVLDLDNFAVDIDGHAVTDIEFASLAELYFDNETHVLSGHKSAFKQELMSFLAREETGLVGVNQADWRKKKSAATSAAGGGGGGGTLPASLLVLLVVLFVARRTTVRA